jgi:hypothetical protein
MSLAWFVTSRFSSMILSTDATKWRITVFFQIGATGLRNTEI